MRDEPVNTVQLGKMIRVVLVDDHPLFRKGLSDLMSEASGLVVVGEAEDRAGALGVIEQTHPDILIVDIALGNDNGLELVKDAMERWPGISVLVLSMFDEKVYAERALKAGAKGYITKQQAPAQVIEAIKTVVKGQIHVSQEIISTILHRYGGVPDPKESPLGQLTNREFEVFRLIGQGCGLKEIGRKMHLSHKTIQAYREGIKVKLGIPTAGELLKYAIKWNKSVADAPPEGLHNIDQ